MRNVGNYFKTNSIVPFIELCVAFFNHQSTLRHFIVIGKLGPLCDEHVVFLMEVIPTPLIEESRNSSPSRIEICIFLLHSPENMAKKIFLGLAEFTPFRTKKVLIAVRERRGRQDI